MLSIRHPASIPRVGTRVCTTVFRQVHVDKATMLGCSLPPVAFSNVHALLPLVGIEEKNSKKILPHAYFEMLVLPAAQERREPV